VAKGAREASGPSRADAPTRDSTPSTPDELHAWLIGHAGVRVSRDPIVEGHDAPFAYLVHSFFEGRGALAGDAAEDHRAESAQDSVVWANRGGGKTFLGAVATMLDLVFKPGIEVRVLGGSMEQSKRMHAHLRRLFDPRKREELASLVEGRITDTRLALKNGSVVELLAQSQTSVRGTRVQKLRCDEVDLFDPEVWEAAQLTTRSATCGPFQVRGSVDCLSTMHRPYGVMHTLVREAREGSRTLFRWGVVDVLEACGDEHACRREDAGGAVSACPLWEECKGRAKKRDAGRAGHVTVRDAIAMKKRVALSTWNCEMLCHRPKRSDAVLPEFDVRTHVVPEAPFALSKDAPVRWVGGMDFGFRAPTVVLLGAVDERGALWIVGERVQAGTVLEEHIGAILQGLGVAPVCPAWIGVDPAGNASNEQTGVSSVAKMRQAGLVVKAGRLGVGAGLDLIRARLAPADKSGPTLYVCARCVKLIESLERYHYPEDDPESVTPVKRDGFDHAVDALRYMVQNLDHPQKTWARSYL
jgi:hypothetical protein